MKKKLTNGLLILVFIIGLSLLLYPTFSDYWNSFHQSRAIANYAEATAEKIAMGRFLDGKITVLFGTHTHVQTADEQILPEGTAYITDIGMTGPKDSVIGMDIHASIKRFETTLPEKYKLAEGDCIFNGVVFEIDDNTNKVTEIKRIYIK